MAFFSFRKGTDSPAQASEPADPIETIRRKAKQRLIGSVVLVLAAVIGLPILFDAQPRPVPVDMAIEIPDKNKVSPLVLPLPANALPAKALPANALPAPQLPASVLAAVTLPVPKPVPAPAPAASAALPPARPAAKVTAGASLDDKEELVPNAAKPKASAPLPAKATASAPAVAALPAPIPTPAPTPAPVKPPSVAKPAPSPAPVPAPAPTVVAKPVARPDDGARARALLEGQPLPAPSSAPAEAATPSPGRFVVQVGAFADAAKAREVRAKLEKAGLKTYTQVVDSEGGQRTRVRVGPFDNKADAAKAADKIKALELAGSVLAL